MGIIDPRAVETRELVIGGIDLGEVEICIGRYRNGAPSLVACGTDGDPSNFTVLSVAIADAVLFPGMTILDENNLPGVTDVLIEAGVVASRTGSIRSGFVDYPMVVLSPRYADAFVGLVEDVPR